MCVIIDDKHTIRQVNTREATVASLVAKAIVVRISGSQVQVLQGPQELVKAFWWVL